MRALSLLLLLPASAWALNEVHVYGIAELGGPNQCGFSDQSHAVHTDTAAAFADEFELLRSSGDWDEVHTINNMSAHATYWMDATKQPALGDDLHADKGVDEADVVFIHTLGNHASNWSEIRMSNLDYGCAVRTLTELQFGDGNLEIAVLKVGQSGDHDVFLMGGYNELKTDDSGLTMWNAFHGESSCGHNVVSYVGDYAAESVFEGVGENWLDEAYSNSVFTNQDDCPVSIVFGSSSSLRQSMYEHGGWRDRKDTGTKSASSYHFMGNCNPSEGSQLPN